MALWNAFQQQFKGQCSQVYLQTEELVWWFLSECATKLPQQPVKLQRGMIPKLNDFLQVQLMLLTCQKGFCLHCWRCSGLFRTLEAGMAQTQEPTHSGDPAAPWAWPLLAAAPGVGQLHSVPLQLLSALCPGRLLLKEYWMSNMSNVSNFVPAGATRLQEITVKSTASCACVPGDCWE